MEYLAVALSINKGIKTLDLSGNIIEDEGVSFLADALSENSTLEYLELSRNKIGDDGVKRLSQALVKNNTLKDINLLFNDEITDTGVMELAKILNSSNSTVKFLYLKWFENTSEDVVKVLENAGFRNEEKFLLWERNTRKQM